MRPSLANRPRPGQIQTGRDLVQNQTDGAKFGLDSGRSDGGSSLTLGLGIGTNSKMSPTTSNSGKRFERSHTSVSNFSHASSAGPGSPKTRLSRSRTTNVSSPRKSIPVPVIPGQLQNANQHAMPDVSTAKNVYRLRTTDNQEQIRIPPRLASCTYTQFANGIVSWQPFVKEQARLSKSLGKSKHVAILVYVEAFNPFLRTDADFFRQAREYVHSNEQLDCHVIGGLVLPTIGSTTKLQNDSI